MEKIKNKAEIEKLLSEAKIQIEDDGFTQNLVQKLPLKKRSDWVIYLSLAVGIGVSFLWGGFEKTIYQLAIFVNSLSKFGIPSTETLSSVLSVFLSFMLISYFIFNKRRTVT